jgi:Mrp family chromosome partitioning ATPase
MVDRSRPRPPSGPDAEPETIYAPRPADKRPPNSERTEIWQDNSSSVPIPPKPQPGEAKRLPNKADPKVGGETVATMKPSAASPKVGGETVAMVKPIVAAEPEGTVMMPPPARPNAGAKGLAGTMALPPQAANPIRAMTGANPALSGQNPALNPALSGQNPGLNPALSGASPVVQPPRGFPTAAQPQARPGYPDPRWRPPQPGPQPGAQPVPQTGPQPFAAGPLALPQPPPIRLPPNPDARLILLVEPDCARAVGFRLLRDNLLAKRLPRILAVSSASEGDGKTTCALNLALSLAEGARVLLVEGNFGDPTLGAIFAIDESMPPLPNTPWLGPYRVGELSRTLHVAALPVGGSAWRFEKQWFEQLIVSLRRFNYEYVIVDAAALAAAPTVSQLVGAVDGTLLAVRSGVTTARALRRATEQIPPGKAIGLALIDAKQA